VQLTHLFLKNFRCFKQLELSIDAPRVVVEGENGSGKSSLIEALHYACYLKSFRSARSPNLTHQSGDGSFFIKLSLQQNIEEAELQIGYANCQKRVKINGKTVHTYRDVMSVYRVVSLAAHDLALVQEGPDIRRYFLNQYCLLLYPESGSILKQYRHVLWQRNKLLWRMEVSSKAVASEVEVWTRQLWELSNEIEVLRLQVLSLLSKQVNILLRKCNTSLSEISFGYVRKKRHAKETFEQFWHRYQGDIQKEVKQRRSMFGVHLDDILITFNGKNARMFASRGQQKLLVVLLKLAQVTHILTEQTDSGLIFLLDDFLTDFDSEVLSELLGLIQELPCQLIITAPIKGVIHLSGSVQKISLTCGRALPEH